MLFTDLCWAERCAGSWPPNKSEPANITTYTTKKNGQVGCVKHGCSHVGVWRFSLSGGTVEVLDAEIVLYASHTGGSFLFLLRFDVTTLRFHCFVVFLGMLLPEALHATIRICPKLYFEFHFGLLHQTTQAIIDFARQFHDYYLAERKERCWELYSDIFKQTLVKFL